MPLDVCRRVESVWMVVGTCWAAGALRSKPVARREKRLSRVAHVAVMAVAFGLLLSPSAGVWILGTRLIPEHNWISLVGLCITAAGCAFAVWARLWLGSNWSGTVTIKQRHEFVTSGPYAVVRHPIYSGLLVGILGTALALGELRGFLALALAFTAWLLKARTEEQFLVAQFGDAYVGYRRKVKQLIPFVL
jgi:protein-S-isoprenylcysteine O-methyltransferase Ste14